MEILKNKLQKPSKFTAKVLLCMNISDIILRLRQELLHDISDTDATFYTLCPMVVSFYIGRIPSRSNFIFSTLK